MPDDPVTALLQRITAANLSMAKVCRRAKVAQSTPSRWAAGADAKLKTIRKLETALTELVREAAV